MYTMFLARCFVPVLAVIVMMNCVLPAVWTQCLARSWRRYLLQRACMRESFVSGWRCLWRRLTPHYVSLR